MEQLRIVGLPSQQAMPRCHTGLAVGNCEAVDNGIGQFPRSEKGSLAPRR